MSFQIPYITVADDGTVGTAYIDAPDFTKWDWAHDPANPDATPVYAKLWSFGGYWVSEDWIQWHNMLKARYGLQIANDTFVAKWFDRSWYEPTLPNDFVFRGIREYAKSNGFYDRMYDNAGGQIFKIGDEIGDTVADVAGNVGAAAKNTLWLTKLLPYLAPLAVVAAIVIFLLPKTAPAVVSAKRAAKSLKKA